MYKVSGNKKLTLCLAGILVILLLIIREAVLLDKKVIRTSAEPLPVNPPPLTTSYQPPLSTNQFSSAKALSSKDWNSFRRIGVIDKLNEYLNAPPSLYENISDHEALAMVPESYVCDKVHFKRIGGKGDGGKWFCGEFTKPQEDCTIFSIGSLNDFTFEEAINEEMKGKCKIYTLDCTGDYKGPDYVTFKKWCLGPENVVVKGGLEYKTWGTILKELGVNRVHYLKMDIEGYEWTTLPAIFDEPSHLLPAQISFEMHLSENDLPKNAEIALEYDHKKTYNDHFFVPVMKLFMKAYKAGYDVASVEKNIMTVSACTEFVLVRPQSLDN